MPTILIAESGSTKTDWCLAGSAIKPLSYKTSGINPFLQSPEDISSLLISELKITEHLPERLFYYGAGVSNPQKQQLLKDIFSSHFKINSIEVESDMLAAARGLCGNEKGIVSILGTGSNSCYYDGGKIKSKMPSLGFIAGDEGSGNYLGKKVLQYYAYKTFDEELSASFEEMYGSDLNVIMDNIYNKPFPNRYLANFVPLLIKNRGHYMVENIIEDGLSQFFRKHILKYRESWKHPLHFTGAVAYEFKDVIEDICHQNELELGTILPSPLEGLVKFHTEMFQ